MVTNRFAIDLPPSTDLVSAPEHVQKLANHLKKIQAVVRKLNFASQTKIKQWYNPKTGPISYKQGDLALQKVRRFDAGFSWKLSACWDGTYHVVYAPFDAPTVIIRLFDNPDGPHDKFNVMLLKKYVERPGDAIVSCIYF